MEMRTVNEKKIEAKFNEKTAICLVINEPFALFASVTLQSIIEFSSDKETYDIFICTDKDLSIVTADLLKKQFADKANFSIRFITLSDFFDTFEKNHYLTWPDQDLINIVFHDKIFFLGQDFNVLVALRDDKTSVESTNDKELIEKYNNSFKNPKVIHFLACSFLAVKYPVQFFDKYWYIARKSPFYETLLSKAVSKSLDMDLVTLLKNTSLKALLKIVIKKILRKG